jgi:hypothetical protein
MGRGDVALDLTSYCSLATPRRDVKLLLATAGPLFAFIFAFWITGLSYRRGKKAGAWEAVDAKLRALGMSRASADNYRQAMLILNKMINIQDLDGPWAETILANAVRVEINRVLAIYRKENEL